MNKTTRKNQALKWTLIILVAFILVAVIGATYSRYTSTSSGTGTAQVAKWAVKLNTVDMTLASNSFTVTFTEVENNNVVDGKIAPGSSLYADFIIDPTGSEVAVDYSFELGAITSTGTVPTGIAVEKVVPVVSGTEGAALTADANGKYNGTIALSSQSAALSASDAKTIRVYIKWTNSDVAADSASHTTAGVATPTLSMTVTGTAQQHI